VLSQVYKETPPPVFIGSFDGARRVSIDVSDCSAFHSAG
jgi:hypothetical protein